MPSMMIHLLCGKKYASESCTAFYAASMAPDVVSNRELKDKTHMRDIPIEERPDALKELALSLDLDYPFHMGVMLHFFADYYWDKGPQADYIKAYVSDDPNAWFIPYRKEIAHSSSFLYHKYNWGPQIWDRILNYDYTPKDCICGITAPETKAFFLRNKKWHEENNFYESEFFNYNLINEFTDKVIFDFAKWIKTIK